jgi:hypothetical protein
VNSPALLLNGPVTQSASATVTYTDAVADEQMKDPLPKMQSDGIAIGLPSGAATVAQTQVVGNRITNLAGTGISASAQTVLIEAIIARNELANLGQAGIFLSGINLGIDISGNFLSNLAVLPPTSRILGSLIAGIVLVGSVNAVISENTIDGIGPPTQSQFQVAAIKIFLSSDVRVAGNYVSNIRSVAGILTGPTHGRLDITDNEVRRVPPVGPDPAPDQLFFSAVFLMGEVINIQGNLLEFFGDGSKTSGPVISAVQGPCTFSNNQCFIRLSTEAQQPFPVEIHSTDSIVAMGNSVRGPGKTDKSPSMVLDAPAITIIGNITYSFIKANPSVPAAMMQLNVVA